MSALITARNAPPATRCRTRAAPETATEFDTSARDPNCRGGPPDGQAQEEVDQVDGHDRGADGTTHCDADPGRAARGVVAVVAVDQDDDQREDQHLDEAVDHVD